MNQERKFVSEAKVAVTKRTVKKEKWYFVKKRGELMFIRSKKRVGIVSIKK